MCNNVDTYANMVNHLITIIIITMRYVYSNNTYNLYLELINN